MISRWLLAVMVLGTPLCAQRIVYTKSFPGSVPAFAKITLTKAGVLTYQEEAVDPEPLTATLASAEITAIFELAERLGHFSKKLESGLKVAKTGDKTYRWEDGAAFSESKYNHTNDEDARALQDWFERITQSERMLMDLERTYKYDRLGVNEIVMRLDAAWQAKRVVAPAQFTVMLDRIAKNEALLNMARDRAAGLSEAFKAAK